MYTTQSSLAASILVGLELNLDFGFLFEIKLTLVELVSTENISTKVDWTSIFT